MQQPITQPIQQQQSISEPQLQNTASNNSSVIDQTLDKQQTILMKIYRQKQVNKQLICSKGKPSQQVCLNQDCQKYGFLCSDQDCQCQSQHVKCVSIFTKRLIKVLQDKLLDLSPLTNKINDQIQKSINQLNEVRNNIFNQINQKYQFIGLSENQQRFMYSLKKNQLQKITGKETWEIHNRIKKQEQISKEISVIQENLIEVWASFEIDMKKFSDNVMKSLKRLGIKTIDQVLFGGSKIIKKVRQSKAITDFFPTINKVKSTNLLYRASDNNFDTKIFYEKCNKTSNTVTLIETQFGKIIGGYTPLRWTRKQTLQDVKDSSCRSFLFSLSQNDKFSYDNSKGTSIMLSDGKIYGPVFGSGTDLAICNKAHQQNSSWSYINYSYLNEKYKYQNKDSYMMFLGSQSPKFKIKEWEVYKLEFQMEQDEVQGN